MLSAFAMPSQGRAASETLTERVYRQLKRAIRTGTFTPGQKLTNRAIAGALDVSPTPAREALMRLVSEGVLEMAGPKTVIVPRLSAARYQEIITIRLALEGIATEKAAVNATEAFVDDLEMVHLGFVAARARKEYVEALRLNEQFHFMIYVLSEQPRLVGLIENLWASTGPALRLLYPKFDARNDGAQPHNDAISALRAGDPKMARAAIERDIQVGSSKILTMLEETANNV